MSMDEPQGVPVEAPKKERRTLWVCGACGNTAQKRDSFKESSCRTWAELCYEDTFKFDDHGQLIFAEAAHVAPIIKRHDVKGKD